MVQQRTYQVDFPGMKSLKVSDAEALQGMTTIKKILGPKSDVWETPNTLEVQRAQTMDIGPNLGDTPKVLRFEAGNNNFELKVNLTAALRRCGADDRLNARYNAAVIDSGGSIAIIANDEGQAQVNECAHTHKPLPVAEKVRKL